MNDLELKSISDSISDLPLSLQEKLKGDLILDLFNMNGGGEGSGDSEKDLAKILESNEKKNLLLQKIRQMKEHVGGLTHITEENSKDLQAFKTEKGCSIIRPNQAINLVQEQDSSARKRRFISLNVKEKDVKKQQSKTIRRFTLTNQEENSPKLSQFGMSMIPDLNFINGSEIGSFRKGSDLTTGSIRKQSDGTETEPNLTVSEVVGSNISVSRKSSDLQGSEKKFKKEIQRFRKKKDPIKYNLVSYDEIKTDLGIGDGVEVKRMELDKPVIKEKSFVEETKQVVEEPASFVEARKMEVVASGELIPVKPTPKDIENAKVNVKNSVNKFIRGIRVTKTSRKRLVSKKSNTSQLSYRSKLSQKSSSINSVSSINNKTKVQPVSVVKPASFIDYINVYDKLNFKQIMDKQKKTTQPSKNRYKLNEIVSKLNKSKNKANHQLIVRRRVKTNSKLNNTKKDALSARTKGFHLSNQSKTENQVYKPFKTISEFIKYETKKQAKKDNSLFNRSKLSKNNSYQHNRSTLGKHISKEKLFTKNKSNLDRKTTINHKPFLSINKRIKLPKGRLTSKIRLNLSSIKPKILQNAITTTTL